VDVAAGVEALQECSNDRLLPCSCYRPVCTLFIDGVAHISQGRCARVWFLPRQKTSGA